MLADARVRFREDCGRGDSAACSAIGVMQQRGLGGPADAAGARVSFERSCTANNARGCANLGATLLESRRPEETARGRMLLTRACQADDPDACTTIALGLLRDGTVPPQVALELFERGCAGNDPEACTPLGDVLAAKDFGPTDSHRALELWVRACVAGFGAACARMDARPREGAFTVAGVPTRPLFRDFDGNKLGRLSQAERAAPAARVEAR